MKYLKEILLVMLFSLNINLMCDPPMYSPTLEFFVSSHISNFSTCNAKPVLINVETNANLCDTAFSCRNDTFSLYSFSELKGQKYITQIIIGDTLVFNLDTIKFEDTKGYNYDIVIDTCRNRIPYGNSEYQAIGFKYKSAFDSLYILRSPYLME